MELSAPTQLVFFISLLLAALAVVSNFVAIPTVSDYTFWVAILAYIVLAAGNVLKGV